MIRLLLIAAIVGVGWYLYRQWSRSGSTPAGTAGSPPAQPQTAIAKCEECGIHAPENTGVRYQDHFFCTPDHLQAWMRRQDQP
ncbi:MAG: PP0621 family protein [Pseudomonadota bacterium]